LFRGAIALLQFFEEKHAPREKALKNDGGIDLVTVFQTKMRKNEGKKRGCEGKAQAAQR